MKFFKPIIVVVISVIFLRLLQGVLYFSLNLALKSLQSWLWILLLVSLAGYLIFKILQIVLIVIPLMRFRLTTPVPSYVIGIITVLFSIRDLYLRNQNYSLEVQQNVFLLLHITEILVFILLIFKMKHFIFLNKNLRY